MSKTRICPYCGRRHSSEHLCEAEFEGWEVDYQLREEQDYEGLIAHYQAVVAWRPDGLDAIYRLGEAYVLNGEPRNAIELLTKPHQLHPGFHSFQHVILDALFAMGKDETDFQWSQEIPVYRLDPSALDRCHAYLKPKRKPRSTYELLVRFSAGYCVFTEDDLLEALRQDDRFVVEGSGFGAEIRVKRGRQAASP